MARFTVGVSSLATWRALAYTSHGQEPIRLRKNVGMGDESFERARLEAAPLSNLNDLRHGWEAVPFQNSYARGFFRSLFSRATQKQ